MTELTEEEKLELKALLKNYHSATWFGKCIYYGIITIAGFIVAWEVIWKRLHL